MPFLALAPDVLQPIVGLLPTPDALSLARVSHSAHALALPRILAHITLGGAFHRPVHALSPNAQLRAFCASVLAHPVRAPLVRSIELRRDAVRRERTYETDPDAVRLLAHVLTRARGLQRATLWGLTQLVDACPSIVDALARCDRLTTVVLGGDVPALAVLQRAFPHVRTLEFVEGACFAPGSPAAAASRGCGWHALDRLSAARPPAPTPSAPVRTRRLTLRDPVPNDESAIARTLAFIKHARPLVLSLAVAADVPDAAFVERLHEACTGDGTAGSAGVRFLELSLSGCRSLARVESWMVSAPSVHPPSTRSAPPNPADMTLTPSPPQTHTAPHLSALPLAGLALRSSTPAAFPTPRPTPAASPLSSPPLLPADPAADVDALALDPDDRAQTVYGAVRRAPPGVAGLARAVGDALPGVRWLALAPGGPVEDEQNGGGNPKADVRVRCEWFEVVGKGRTRARCVGEEEAVRVRRRLEGMGRWD
ncbi:uncharacterized protein C8Q71DRAFT_862728 [Rhodofomes roseus]|uniref:F-box domain-containing protein n=1 Tax=Rhodofomes roseus TaxID=34475 RepID=A0ABQ8K0I3_9APHY|nr:uncharacterized protein C8Q71DRAFT_862728 [Rhodofomes roseus]KAH9830141.1 hypothetical protein C8Q71DRAFT_862728 [Rhodofomes roseus]